MTYQLGPRPGSGDQMIAAAHRANVGAAVELRAQRLRETHAHARRPAPLDLATRLDRVERDLEAVVALLAEREAA